MKATIIVVGDENTPSSRIRAYRYQPLFEQEGWQVSFINAHDLYRISSIYQLFTSQWVLLQKCIISILALKLMRLAGIRLFYDFDDAIYLKYSSDRNSKFVENLRKADKVFAGNQLLAKHAKRFQPMVAIIPTPVEIALDSAVGHITKKDPFVVGWIGTQPNLKYLDLVVPALEALFEEGYPIVLRVVSSEAPALNTIVPVDFRKWSLLSEDELIDGFDLGVMPLANSEWERGKCSYKLLSYMARRVPAVASPVGMNTEVIKHGKNGFLADGLEAWIAAIGTVLSNSELRGSVGEAGFDTVRAHYDRKVVFEKLKHEILSTLGR